jgi:cytochrome P450
MDAVHFDPLGPERSEDLWSCLKELRDGPVVKTEEYGGIWLVTKYEDVTRAARDYEAFCSRRGAGPVPRADVGDVKLVPIETDPPVHRPYRKLIDRHFRPEAVAAAEGTIRGLAVDLLDRFIASEAHDFVAEFAVPFPAQTFFAFAFGVGVEESGMVMDWLDALLMTPNAIAKGRTYEADAVLKLYDWTRGLLERRRGEPACGDVIDSLLHGTVDGRALTDSEQMMMVMNLLGGGLETTTSALGSMVYHLARRPELRRRLDADRGLIPAAVEEFLRLDAPAPGVGRTSTCPVSMGQVTIAPDERVILYLGSANRDPAAFANPDEIDLDRYAGRCKPHLTFGTGPHFCPGAHLARLELSVALSEILDRLGEFRLASPTVRFGSGITRGPIAMPLTLT